MFLLKAQYRKIKFVANFAYYWSYSRETFITMVQIYNLMYVFQIVIYSGSMYEVVKNYVFLPELQRRTSKIFILNKFYDLMIQDL